MAKVATKKENIKFSSFPGGVGTVHWIQDNFVFGQNSKSFLLFRNGLVRSFGIFYATFDEQSGDFFIPKVTKVDLKNSQFWACFGVFE